MLAEGYTTRRGRRARLPAPRRRQQRAARAARRARSRPSPRRRDPRPADYQVVLEPEELLVGTLNEDFAVESMAGDIFQLGNTSWRIRRSSPAWSRRGRARPAADDPVLARRSAGPQRRAVGMPCRALRARRARRSSPRRPRGLRSAGCATSIGLGDERGAAARRLPRRGQAALGALPTPKRDRLRALLRRDRRHAARRPLAVRLAHQPRLGPGAAQALLPALRLRAAGGRERGRDRALARRRSTASRSRRSQRYLNRRHGARRAGAGAARRADVRHALALERDAALAVLRIRNGKKRARRSPAHGRRRTCSPRCSPTSSPAPRTWPATREIPDHPLVAQTIERLPARGDGRRRLRARCCARIEAGDVEVHLPRRSPSPRRSSHEILERAALRVPRRRAARGAAHAAPCWPAATRRRSSGRARHARPRSDRARARARPGRRCATPTSCTMRWCCSVS